MFSVVVLILCGLVYKVSAQHGYISLNARALSDTQVLVSRYDIGYVELANLDFAYRVDGESRWRTTRFNPTREYFAYEYLNSSTLYYFRLAGRQARTYTILHAYTHIRTPPYTQRPPGNVTVVTQSDGSVHVRWSPELDGRVLGYLVIYTEVDDNERALTEYKVKPAFRTCQTTLRDIKVGSRYKVEVASISLDGEGVSKQSAFAGEDKSRGQSAYLRITIPPRDIMVKDEGTVILACGAEGFPSPKITWRKSGRRFIDRKRRFLEESVDGVSILRIDPIVSSQDRGTYTCTASNGVGKTERARAVVRTYNGKSKLLGYPIISQHPVLQYVEEGSKVTMNCTSDGTPGIITRWYRNSFPINYSKDIRVALGANAQLIISKTKKSDEGTYECSAENNLGITFSYPAHLYVKERIQRTMAPEFLRARLSYKIPFGETVILPCDAIGQPVPEVWWEKNGKRQKGRSHNGQNILTLPDVKASADYTCVASNALDTIRRNYSITVIRPKTEEDPSPPVFTPTDLLIKVKFRASPHLVCEARGVPIPYVEWTDSYGKNLKRSMYGQNVLRLYRLRRPHNYTCTASNTEGKVSQVYTVRVAPRGHMVDRPIRLIATRVENNEIEVTWHSPRNATGVIGFVVYLHDVVAKHRDRTEVPLVYKYKFTGLLSNKLYQIRVASLGKQREGLSTKYITVQTTTPRRRDVFSRPPY